MNEYQIGYSISTKLSKESKEDILYTLKEKGVITLVKDRYGREYVILGDLI